MCGAGAVNFCGVRFYFGRAGLIGVCAGLGLWVFAMCWLVGFTYDGCLYFACGGGGCTCAGIRQQVLMSVVSVFRGDCIVFLSLLPWSWR